MRARKRGHQVKGAPTGACGRRRRRRRRGGGVLEFDDAEAGQSGGQRRGDVRAGLVPPGDEERNGGEGKLLACRGYFCLYVYLSVCLSLQHPLFLLSFPTPPPVPEAQGLQGGEARQDLRDGRAAGPPHVVPAANGRVRPGGGGGREARSRSMFSSSL